MDPVRNPYTPGAGTQPPELAGRDELREKVKICIERTILCRPARSVLMVGLRGVGKTVLLSRMQADSTQEKLRSFMVEAPEGRSLPSILAPKLRQVLLDLSRIERIKSLASRGLRALAGFTKALRIKYGDIEVGLDEEPEPGLADNGILEDDLQALLLTIGQACSEGGLALAIFVDELQYVPEKQLSALITSLHRTAQLRLPLVLVGAGLPQLRGQMGKAKSYAERLFDFPEVGPLEYADAHKAIEKPAGDEGVRFQPEALDRILANAQGYPYFLQEWGMHVWDVANQSPINIEDVETATSETIASLDEGFFRVRFDRMTPAERRYLRAMAELGPGPHRSGDIADQLDRKVTSLGPVRAKLINKGMVWSPSHGDTAFTVPLFDQFMKRIMPGPDWRQE